MELKYKPLRMCVCCRKRFNKEDLMRVAMVNGELSFDNKLGRGAYICKNEECLKKLEKSRALDRAFKQKIDTEAYKKLIIAASKSGEQPTN